MNCYIHSDQEAVAFCRTCGKALCSACQRTSGGTIYCPEHAPVAAPQPVAAVRPAGPPSSISPGLAFVLGLIPGVGAIYNGQYAKGVVHVVVLGTLISIISSGSADAFEALFGLMIALWFFYMAFEAYHTASKRLRGEPVDEFSSLIPVRSPKAGSTATAIALILLGALFLIINTMPEWTRVIFRLWPAILILIGGWMLLARWRERGDRNPNSQEVTDEQR